MMHIHHLETTARLSLTYIGPFTTHFAQIGHYSCDFIVIIIIITNGIIVPRVNCNMFTTIRINK